MKKVKRIIQTRVLIILISLSTAVLKAQLVERYIHDDPFTFSSCAEYLHSHIYFNKASNLIYDFRSEKQWIYKANLALQSVDSVDVHQLLQIDSTDYSSCNMIRRNGDNIELLFSEFRFNTAYFGGYYTIAHLLVLDTLLQVQEHVEFADSSTGIELYDFVEANNRRVFSGFLRTDSNLTSCIITQKLGNNQYSRKIYPSSLFSDELVFYRIYRYHSGFVISTSANFATTTERLVLLDDSLNITRLTSMYDGTGELLYMPNPGYMLSRNQKNPVYLSSAVSEQHPGRIPPYMLMGVGILDSNFEFARIDTFTFSGSNSFPPISGVINPKPIQDAFDYRTADSAILAMAGQEMLYPFGYDDKFANDVYLYNYNGSTENNNWVQIYNNGYTQSSYIPVAALPNNQYLVILNEYNWDKYPYRNLSIHLMILNGNGDFISQAENPFARNIISAYPNPFKDFIELSGLKTYGNDLHFSLVNLNGSEIERGAIEPSGLIHFKKDHHGAFVLRVFQAQELVQSTIVFGE